MTLNIAATALVGAPSMFPAGFTQLLSDLPNASWALKTQIFDGDLLFLEWAADSAATHADDGVDTFVFRDGLIRVQTARYSVRDKG